MTSPPSQAALDEAVQSSYGDQFDKDARTTPRSVGGAGEVERTRHG